MDNSTREAINQFLAQYETLAIATEQEGQPYVTRAFFVEEPVGTDDPSLTLYGTFIVTSRKLANLRQRQVDAVKYLDTVVEELFDIVPRNTYITITSDHGELFGEEGYFGHGPIHHEKVFEVPFVEGKIR